MNSKVYFYIINTDSDEMISKDTKKKSLYESYKISGFPCPICGCFISGNMKDSDEWKCVSCETVIKVDHKKADKDILNKLNKIKEKENSMRIE